MAVIRKKYDNFDEKVRLLGLNYPDVNQYLSLVHETIQRWSI